MEKISSNLNTIFNALIEKDNSMCSIDKLNMLYRNARAIAEITQGFIVEIGAYRGASTIALALGVKDAGKGKVYSIDPHRNFSGIFGGKFSPEDHEIYIKNIEKYELTDYIHHICSTSEVAVKGWNLPIDLLWIDGDHSYQGVAKDIINWLPFVKIHGIVIFDDYTKGSDVEASVADHFPFSQYVLNERIGSALAFRKLEFPRKLYLCGGMQSSGSTLVSWCFLQRNDLNGIYDMPNYVIQQDFSYVRTQSVWVKMTIGAFRLGELKELYEAQGWNVQPLLIQRDLNSILSSLRDKEYGFDGCTGDEPPLFLRAKRYLADLEQANLENWPILVYEKFIDDPINQLKEICRSMQLKWDESMHTWHKTDEDISNISLGNVSFRETRAYSTNLIDAVEYYKKKKSNSEHKYRKDIIVQVLLNKNDAILQPSPFRGSALHESNTTKMQLNRIYNHMVFKQLLMFWKRFINPSFPDKF